mgnify:CR=1 FL=1|jgi:hypothetical protein
MGIKTDWKEDKLMCRELKEDDISLVSDAMLSDFLKNKTKNLTENR